MKDNILTKYRGFSLIEIMVVLVIIGLLASIVAPNILNRAEDARIQKAQADITAIETALKMYKLDNYSYPSTEQGLQALVEKPTLEPIPKNWKKEGYLDALPIDPWGREYLYLNPGEKSQNSFDIFSYGADGIANGEGEDADIGNWIKKE